MLSSKFSVNPIMGAIMGYSIFLISIEEKSKFTSIWGVEPINLVETLPIILMLFDFNIKVKLVSICFSFWARCFSYSTFQGLVFIKDLFSQNFNASQHPSFRTSSPRSLSSVGSSSSWLTWSRSRRRSCWGSTPTSRTQLSTSRPDTEKSWSTSDQSPPTDGWWSKSLAF